MMTRLGLYWAAAKPLRLAKHSQAVSANGNNLMLFFDTGRVGSDLTNL